MPGFAVVAVPHRFQAGQIRTNGVLPVSMFIATASCRATDSAPTLQIESRLLHSFH